MKNKNVDFPGVIRLFSFSILRSSKIGIKTMPTSIFLVYHILFILVLPRVFMFYFKLNEAALILNLLKRIGINQCIFVQNERGKLDIFTVKNFSSEAVSSVYLDYNQIIQLVENGLNKYDITSVHTNVAIIFNENDTTEIDLLLAQFKASNNTARMSHFTWLAIIENSHSKIKSQEKDLILYDCEFIIIHPFSATTYSLKEIYMIKDKFYSNNFGIWDKKTGLQTTNVPLFYRRFDLNQTEIVLAADVDRVGIVVYSVFYYISQIMNFKFIPILRDKIQNSTFKNDLDVNSFVLTLDTFIFRKNAYFSFYPLGPMVKTTVNWYIKYPKERKMAHYYIQPFEIDLWIAIASSITIGTVLMVVINAFNKNSTKKLIDDVFMSLDCYFNQNGCRFISYIPTRIICVTLRLSAVIIVASYLAIIMSFLTFKIIKAPFRSLKGLKKKGYLLALDNLFVLYSIQRKLEKSGHLKYLPNMNDENNDYVTKICSQKLVYVDFNHDIYYKNLKCRILQIKPPLLRADVYFGLAGYRHLKKAFDQNLIRYYESGIRSRMQKLVDLPPLRFPYEKDDTYDGVEITQMTQVMLIPVFGIGLAFLISLIEIVYYAYVKRKRRSEWERKKAWLKEF